MDILMAVLALRRRGFEIDVNQLSSEVRRFVAVDAGCCPMRSQERELRLGVIESRYFLPRLGHMASFTSRGRSIGTNLQHPFLELTLVRVGMATGASQVVPVIDHRLRLERVRFLVALSAGSRQMSAGQ